MEPAKIQDNLSSLNFIAIDLETANEQRNSICSIGIVTVRNGEIVNKLNLLVKPKEMRFTEVNQRLHGISEKDVENAPEFHQIWEQIYPIIHDQILLAHNTDFDIDALQQTLYAYNLRSLPNRYICTQKLAQETFLDLINYRLPDVAKHLGLQFTHHDSLSDATIAAEIGIRAVPLYDHKKFSLNHNELTYHISKRSSAEKKNDKFTEGFKDKKLDSRLLTMNLTDANPDNPFYNRKVVFTGDLSQISRSEAAQKVQALGADINGSISKLTEIVIVGAGAGPAKMKKIEELNSKGIGIRLIYEDEFLALIR